MTEQEPRDRGQALPAPGSPNRIRTTIWALVAASILGLLVLGLLSTRQARPAQGDPAPSFALTMWDGSRVSLRDLRGEVVVLNFWASWCTPCEREAPALQSVWETYQDRGVTFLGVTYQDAEEAGRAFVDEYGITYANGTDERGQISRAYGVLAVPETFVIDAQGVVARIYVGEVEADALAAQIEGMLGP
ncbi:MAG: TlpA family protein disulfide reductase [Anaerolineae bacterium]|nr:TlpA family protein disulfide reductase [Anaerolineae bacterium]